MITETYRYRPTTGELVLMSGGQEYPTEYDTRSILNGEYRLVGTTLRDSGGRIVENIGGGDVTITRMIHTTGEVVVDLSSGIGRSTLNAEGPRLATYSVTGDVTVLDHLGQERSINVEAAAVTGLGQRMLAYRGETDQWHYEVVSRGSDQEDVLREIFGDTVHWATASEYEDAAIIGWISRNEARLVNEIKNAGGMYDADGMLQTEASGIIRALAQAARGSLAYTKSIRFNASGNIRGMYE